MKSFGSGNAPFTAPNGDIPEGNSAELTRPTNQFFNNAYGEQKRLIEASGQALTTNVADDNQQTAKAVFAHAVRAQSVVATGGNDKTLTLRGAFIGTSHVLLDGAIYSFECNSTTTGAVTLFITGVSQPAPYPLQWQGAAMDANTVLTAGQAYDVRYDLAGSRFVLITPPKSYLVDLIRVTAIDLLYPVGGQPYFSINSANPATYLGHGTWVAWGGGTHLSFAGTSDGVTLTAGVSGSHTHELTMAELPADGVVMQFATTASGGAVLPAVNAFVSGSTTGLGMQSDGSTYTNKEPQKTQNLGNGDPVPIRPRTTTIYGWVRTA